jgi:hypothetical protein
MSKPEISMRITHYKAVRARYLSKGNLIGAKYAHLSIKTLQERLSH